MAETRWFTQKPEASAFIKNALDNGQEIELETLMRDLRSSQGLGVKNARKAIYAEVAEGTIVLTGDWETGKLKKAGV